VHILEDLERFKDLPTYVRCIESPSDSSSEILEKDSVLELESIGMNAMEACGSVKTEGMHISPHNNVMAGSKHF
jgi:hypothetical protein